MKKALSLPGLLSVIHGYSLVGAMRYPSWSLASPKVKAALDGRELARTIFVRDRLVNFVTLRRS